MFNIHWTMCPITFEQSENLLIKIKMSNKSKVGQNIFALFIMYIRSYKSHFVQPNVVCPTPAVQAFWTPAPSPLAQTIYGKLNVT